LCRTFYRSLHDVFSLTCFVRKTSKSSRDISSLFPLVKRIFHHFKDTERISSISYCELKVVLRLCSIITFHSGAQWKVNRKLNIIMSHTLDLVLFLSVINIKMIDQSFLRCTIRGRAKPNTLAKLRYKCRQI